MKIGFFGAGNMASAIVGGAVSSGNFKAEDISVYDIDNTKARLLSDEFSVCVSESPDSLIDFADAVVLAVKPNIFRRSFRQYPKSSVKTTAWLCLSRQEKRRNL